MITVLLFIYALAGIAFFLLAFLKDKPATKKLYKILALVFVLSLPFVMTEWVSAFNMAILYCMLAIGLNILLGNAGLISLGHAAFFAIGAYASAILTLHAGWPIFLAIVVSGIITAIIGFLLGTPVLRLKGHFLAIATLGLHVVIENMIKDKLKFIVFEAFGNSPNVPEEFRIGAIVKNLEYSMRDSLASLDYFKNVLGDPHPFYYNFVDNITKSLGQIAIFFTSLILLVLMVYMARNILRTKVGRALAALRDSEIAARMLGVNIALYKNIAFGLSAFYAGIAGAIYGHSIGALAETSFGIMISLIVLAMIIIGGVGAIQGAIIGAVFFKLLDMKIIPEILLKISGDPSVAAKAQVWAPFIMGAILVIVIIFAPKGMVYMLWQLKLKMTQKRS